MVHNCNIAINIHVYIQDEKTLRDVGIADQQKTGKQGRDDSIKQFSTLLIFNVERYIRWGCILNCFMLSSGLRTLLTFF